MDEARQAQEQEGEVALRLGARVRFRHAGTHRIVAESYTVLQVDRAAGKAKVLHVRPRGHAYGYVFWYDITDLEEEPDGTAARDRA